MDLPELARKLILEVEGFDTDKNVEGVVEVFKGFITGIDQKWERHIVETTNMTLAADRLKCLCCGTQLTITRDASRVYISADSLS